MLLVVIFFFSHTPSTTTLPPIHIPLWQVQELLRYQGRLLKIGSSGQLEVLPDRPERGTTSDDPKVIVDDEASDFVIKGGDVISPRDGEGGDVISPSDSKGGDMISPRDSGGGDVNTGHDDGNDANTVQGDEEVNTNIDHDNEEEQSTKEFIPDQPDTSPVRKPAHIPKRFIIEEADYCKKRPNLQVIAYVHSSIMRVTQRMQTRQTWANASAYNLGDISVKVGAVFMVGRAKNEVERMIVKEESQRYHDIIQGDYGDHYRLLTYKGLAGLYWINKHCSQVPWTLHADDDTHIDIFLYHQALNELNEESRQNFVCSHMYGPAIRSGKWKVRYEEYPAKNYPLYCSGGAWFLQTKFIPRLLEASKVVPFLWVDDAYISGLLAKQAGIKQLPFQKYYGGPRIKMETLGHEVVWFIKFAPRSIWWNNIVNYHRNYSMHNPVTLLPKEAFVPK
ncbi:uncharacterized protein LOC121871786 [Homarus americanus]|uniref:uncharacterized protein LOC121871786 n=1 Tax=Homarus americanus TaxID=6706 RepID=UPI001C47315C|nr:uncharacterized protein LOC121871786 [Homarus americanus]